MANDEIGENVPKLMRLLSACAVLQFPTIQAVEPEFYFRWHYFMCDIGIFEPLFLLLQFMAINLPALVLFLALRLLLRGRNAQQPRT